MRKLNVDIPIGAIIWNGKTIYGDDQAIRWGGWGQSNRVGAPEEAYVIAEMLGIPVDRAQVWPISCCSSSGVRGDVHPAVLAFFAPKDNEEALHKLRSLEELEV